MVWLLCSSVITHAQITSFPHTESFDGTALPTGWTNVYGNGTTNWTTETAAVGGSPLLARTGARMARFVAYNSTSITKLVSPQLDLTSLTNPQLKFYFANVSWGDDIDILKVYIRTSATGAWTQLGSAVSTSHPTWTEQSYVLPNASSTYYIAIECESEYGYGLYIDDVTIEEGPTCPAPISLVESGVTTTSLNLNWTPLGSETVWNVQWGAPGFSPLTGTPVGTIGAAGTPSASISTLSPGGTYHFYVQADCGAGDESSWLGPLVVTTPDVATPAPFYDDFSTSQWVPVGTGTNKWCIGSGTGNTGNSLYVSSDGSTYAYNTGSATTASHAYKTVSVPAGPVGSYKIRFDWKGVAEGTWDFTRVWLVPVASNISPNTLITTGNTTGAVQLVGSLVGGTNWANVSYNVPAAFLGTTFKVVFEWKNDASSGGTPTAIDNFALYSDVPSPVISQSSDVPTCVTGTNLSVVDVATSPIIYYWQTTATGTSTTNNASTPWTVFENGTYYVRAYNSFTQEWSTATSSNVTSIPTIANPPVPLAAANPACLPGTEIVMASAPAAGVEYYWQGTSSTSSSQANDASSPYFVTETGTYYVKAFDTASSCWSEPVGLPVTIHTYIPPAPIADPNVFAFCTSDDPMTVNVDAPNVSGTVTLTATQSGPDNTLTPTISDFSGVQGTVTSAILSTSITSPSGTSWCPSWYAYNLVINGVTVATNQCNNASFDLTPYLPLTSITAVSINNDSAADQAQLTITATINYANPAPIITWYDSETGGNIVNVGESFNFLGSSILPTSVEGLYELFTETTSGACPSETRTPVFVNVNNVVVDLIPQSVTCNNGNDGTFAVESILCGVEPFTFSVDGGAFSGIIPTDLTIGEHTIVVKDANDNESAEYIITIGNAQAPFNVTEVATTNNQSTIYWTAPGSEIQWNVVWGPIGFTPGDATQIGAATANDTTFVITDLLGNTEYDIFVSADCGNGTVAGDWNSVSVWTECDAYNLPFFESFEDNSASVVCWTLENASSGSWFLGVGSEDSGPVTTAYEGQQNAYYDNGSSGRLVSPTMLLNGQDSVAVIFAISQAYWPSDQNTTTLAKRNGTSGAWTAVKTYTDNIPQWMLDTVVVSTTGFDSLQLSFLAVDEIGYNNTIDNFIVESCYIEPTADGNITLCRSEGSIDLTSVVTPMASGVWNGGTVNSFVNGSMFNISNLMEGTYEIKHIAKTACAYDTAVVTITVTAPLSAGTDGTINVCKNQPIGLFTGLSGNVDYGGTWYNAAGVALTGSTFTTGTLQGQQVYTYVVSNGICDADTAQVIVNISSCNFIGVEDIDLFENVTISPNPSTGIFNIEGVNSPNFTYEVIDLNGRVIKGETKITSSVTSVNLSEVETGIYMIRLKGEGSEKMIRLIKQ